VKVPEAHVHGAIILAKEWFAYQVAYTKTVHHYSGNSLLRFVQKMMHDVGSFPMHQASIDRYFSMDAPPPGPQVNAGK
jgi:hypothetical protein